MSTLAINGYGRIGRCILRAIVERNLQDQLNIVAINDLADFSLLAHLTRYDSTHGPFQASINQQNDLLTINGKTIQFLSLADRRQLPWSELGVDIVLECSGTTKERQLIEQHLQAGAKKVLVSHPMETADATVVLGVNHSILDNSCRIISNASCTTNCVAPLAKVLHEVAGISTATFTTIHAYTNGQHLLDQALGDAYRCRAAALSMIPAKTGAAKAVEQVLPELADKLSGMAIRVPTPNVSMVDFNFVPASPTSAETINLAFKAASQCQLKDIINYSDAPLVSIDFNHHPASAIVDTSQTAIIQHCEDGKSMAKVMAWYDNEWGFANRMVDMSLYLENLAGC